MSQVFDQMPEELLRFLEDELAFFDKVTDISGSLYSVPKDERKAGAVKLARQVGSQTVPAEEQRKNIVTFLALLPD